MAAAYLANNTDIRATLGVLLRSPEFAASAGRRIKTPMRAMVSYLRVLNVGIIDVEGPSWRLEKMGQPFFEWDLPNGYPQAGSAWVSTSNMLARWNTAFAVADGWDDNPVNLTRFLPAGPVNAQQLVDSVGQALLNRPVPAAARTALIAYVGGGGLLLEDWVLEIKLVHVVALILGSPAFQVH